MPKSIEAQGVTVDEAIQTALNLLGLGRDSVEIEIIHHPRSGFLGIGARRAKVRATMRERVMKDGEEFDMSPDGSARGRRRRRAGRRRGGRGDGEQRPGEGRPRASESAGRRAVQEPRTAGGSSQKQGAGTAEGDATRADQRTGEQRGRGRGRRGGRGRGATERKGQEDLAETTPPADKRPVAEGTTEATGGDRTAGAKSRTREQSAPARQDPEALRSRAEKLTSELLGHMGVEASLSVRIEEGGSISVTVSAEEGGAVLIGRRGTTLDALEHIINRMTTGADPGARVRVALDVCGYRERRKASLAEVAARLKQHALSTGRRAQITPLSPSDRVVFQEALAGDDSVSTRILGSGFYRRVLVIPRGRDVEPGVTEEFNEEGQIVGFPGAGDVTADAVEDPSEDPGDPSLETGSDAPPPVEEAETAGAGVEEDSERPARPRSEES